MRLIRPVRRKPHTLTRRRCGQCGIDIALVQLHVVGRGIAAHGGMQLFGIR